MSNSESLEPLAIPERFFEKSDFWGLRSSVRLLGVPLIWIFLLPVFNKWSPFLAIAVTVPLGIAISKTTLLVHEALHGTLFDTPAFNRIAGRLGGWWTLVDFISFDALHRHHHSSVGENDDPQILDYGKLQFANRQSLFWHLVRPLIGWNILHMVTLIRKRLEIKRDFSVSIMEFAGLFVVQGAFFLIATSGAEVLWLGFVFTVAAATVGLFMSQIRGFCEHIPMPGEEAKMRCGVILVTLSSDHSFTT